MWFDPLFLSFPSHSSSQESIQLPSQVKSSIQSDYTYSPVQFPFPYIFLISIFSNKSLVLLISFWFLYHRRPWLTHWVSHLMTIYCTFITTKKEQWLAGLRDLWMQDVFSIFIHLTDQMKEWNCSVGSVKAHFFDFSG